MNLSTAGAVTRCLDGAAAGTGTSNGTVLDMSGYNSVCFYLLIGTIDATGTVTLKCQQGTESDGSDMADLEGTAIAYTASDDNAVAVLEVTAPRERYVRPVCVRATANSVLDGCIAIQHEAQVQPVTHSSDVVSSEHHLSPAEGTA